jgi:hypothetical protein
MAERIVMSGRIHSLLVAGVVVVITATGIRASGKDKVANAPFKYVAGTERLPEGCQGSLQVGVEALKFICPEGAVSVPYSAITFMQYRPEVSRKVSKMKIKWQVKPPSGVPLLNGKKNRYFVIVYAEQGKTNSLVLEVPPLTMRPYLAEIDLKAGKRVEVYEEYN